MAHRCFLDGDPIRFKAESTADNYPTNRGFRVQHPDLPNISFTVGDYEASNFRGRKNTDIERRTKTRMTKPLPLKKRSREDNYSHQLGVESALSAAAGIAQTLCQETPSRL